MSWSSAYFRKKNRAIVPLFEALIPGSGGTGCGENETEPASAAVGA